ncbi:RNA-binding protein POP5 KNAG_0D04940 [Huiozyma naganishii CBS 8797]|uniref:Ribonuclease P/MRP protein subunit POP5 n=1 Tax=Huiozyma naganishii (strain ATCC MYA-139 / BCRC 22969 / CBS 8797 / KCTC 17520 / NBRC 10181 / NCYC 3082 / Yp74L-3) TaxID=1071383 RepID=J7RL51_HUIN7|nr:hypothetical protein KNAG_0D04940 [Kazachstania naganishii CBS 8797]CCK70233.1 hypothetical protein KNAG_0D04940 [Kazachstania naganishii CBS 8797]
MVRLKSRYVLFEIVSPVAVCGDGTASAVLSRGPCSARVTAKTILQEIRRSLQVNFGDYGAGKVGSLLQVKYFSNNTATGILRCHREDVDLLLGALFFMSNVGESPEEHRGLIVNPVKVSGTIKKVEQFAVRRGQKLVALTRRQLAGPDNIQQKSFTDDFTSIIDDNANI